MANRSKYAARVSGGTVVIRGFWLNENRTGPLESTLFSLHMLLSTEAGDISTMAQMENWLTEVGFEQPRLIQLPAWLGSNLYVAHKPQ